MMEIYGTIQFRLILPHIPGFQQEPLPEPVLQPFSDCKGLPYPRHGFSAGVRTGLACGAE